MNVKTILILIAAIAGTILFTGGSYIAITNLINPEGYLFEGVVLASIGLVLNMLIVVATTVGQTIVMFTDVLKKQTELYEKVREQEANQNRGSASGLGGLFSELMKNAGGEGSISIQDLDDPDSGPRIIQLGDIDNDGRFKDTMSQGEGRSNRGLSSLSMEQLEDKLSKAVTEDKFEEAEKIKKEIQSRKGSSDGESEKKR